jgi:hypothetical protein
MFTLKQMNINRNEQQKQELIVVVDQAGGQDDPLDPPADEPAPVNAAGE